jgi:hypothetical protein
MLLVIEDVPTVAPPMKDECEADHNGREQMDLEGVSAEPVLARAKRARRDRKN